MLVGDKRRKVIRRVWSKDEKEAVRSSFEHLYVTNTLPGKNDIVECISKNPCLVNRTWRQVKDFVRNAQKTTQLLKGRDEGINY